MTREISDREKKTREILSDLHGVRILLEDMRRTKGIAKIHREMIKRSGFLIGVTCYNIEKYLTMKGTKAKDYKGKLEILHKQLLARKDGLVRKQFKRW